MIAFKDNSSVIEGYSVKTLLPDNPGRPSALAPADVDYHLLLTAETHNFPTGVAPFPALRPEPAAGSGMSRGREEGPL